MAGYVAGRGRTNTLAIADAFLPPLRLGHHLPSARHLPINKPLNPAFLPFQESLWERTPQSVSFPVPVCFSLVFKPRLVLGHLSTDSLPLKRGIQSSVSLYKPFSCLDPPFFSAASPSLPVRPIPVHSQQESPNPPTMSLVELPTTRLRILDLLFLLWEPQFLYLSCLVLALGLRSSG